MSGARLSLRLTGLGPAERREIEREGLRPRLSVDLFPAEAPPSSAFGTQIALDMTL